MKNQETSSEYDPVKALSEAMERKAAAKAERQANLSRTLTGRLILILNRLNMEFPQIMAVAILASINIWVGVWTILYCLGIC